MKNRASAKYRKGRAHLAKIHGRRGLAKVDSISDLAPDLARWIYEWPFAEIYPRPGLTRKERQLVTVSALTALGYARSELVAHLHGSLNIGLTKKQLVEAITQIAIYAGFPAAIRAVGALRQVLEERKKGRTRQARVGDHPIISGRLRR